MYTNIPDASEGYREETVRTDPPSGTASTILAGPSGALGFTGELAADLFEARTLIRLLARTTSDIVATGIATYDRADRWHLLVSDINRTVWTSVYW